MDKTQVLSYAIRQYWFQEDYDAYIGYCDSEEEVSWLNIIHSDDALNAIMQEGMSEMSEVLNQTVDRILAVEAGRK